MMHKPLRELLEMAGVVDIPPLADKVLINSDPASDNCKWPPFPHQVSSIHGALKHVRYGMFDEPGCGKTLPAQAVALYYVGFGNKVAVVMPPILITQFVQSLTTSFIGVKENVNVRILRDGPADREELFGEWERTGNWPDILCMSYQMFINAMRELRDDPKNPGKKKRVKVDKEVYRYLKDAGYGVLITDEAQALKNITSHVHKAVAVVAGTPQTPDKAGDFALILMTGTPIHNTFEDAYGIIKLLRPWQYLSQATFERMHCEYTGAGRNKKLIGYKNIQILHRNLYASASRVLKKDVFKMDEPRIQQVPIKLSKEHKALYDKLVRERFLEMGDRIIEATNQSSLRQKCLRMILTPQMFTEKKVVNNVVAGIDTLIDSIGVYDEKVIIFAWFRESIEALFEHYYGQGYNPAIVYGDSGTKAAKNIDKFKTNPTCRVAIMNPLSGGVGVDGLQKVCSYAIFAEPLSVPGWFKQAAERLYRPGQKSVAQIYIMKAMGTLAPKATDDMLEKESVTKLVNHDASSLLDELMGVGFDEAA